MSDENRVEIPGDFLGYLEKYHPEVYRQVQAANQDYEEALFTLWGKVHEAKKPGRPKKEEPRQEQGGDTFINQKADGPGAIQIGSVGKGMKGKLETPGGTKIEFG